MKIYLTERCETIEYAAEELKKYIVIMSRGEICPTVTDAAESRSDGITLGTLSKLSLDTSDLFDPETEDIVDADVVNGVGYLAGSNPRSILFAVYKYCASLGCRYLRPGPDGDYVPKADIKTHVYRYRKKADSAIRGEIVEGCISYEHCRDTAYFLPKLGMNAYMIEGHVPYTYMHKWYAHVGNTRYHRKGRLTSYDMLYDYMQLLKRDIKRVGLQLHTLGHAWMFEKLGVKHSHEKNQDANICEEHKPFIALLHGKREMKHGDPFYTHFCYSNPGARQILVDTVVEYAQKNRHVDFVHLWLADSTNNWCECEACQELEPSDHYVRLLNEIDAALTAEGLNTRIVMIMYVETVRPPVKLKLNNPSRFILTVAIGNHSENGYQKTPTDEPLPPYELNHFKSFSAPLQFRCHDEWKRNMGIRQSSIFEYRFYMDHYADLSYMQIARETHRDMKSLGAMDFQGCMSDKTHRNYMPTGLPMIMMGETLFDNDACYEKITSDYFEGAFGEAGVDCRAYLEQLSTLLSPSNYRVKAALDADSAGIGVAVTQKKCWRNNPEVAERARNIPALIDSFLPVIEDNIAYADNNAQLESWMYLGYHAELCRRFSKVLLAGAEGSIPRAQEAYFELERYVSEHEMLFHRVFDGFLFLRAVRAKIDLPAVPYYD